MGLTTLVRLLRQCSMYVGIFSVFVRQYAQYGHVLVYIGILFGLSTAMFYVCWYFIQSQYVSTLGTAVFYACLYFIRSQYVSTLSTAMFYVCWYFFRSWYVSTLQYGNVLMYVAIFFGLSTLVRLVRLCSMQVCIFLVVVRQYAQYGNVLCMLVFFSVLVRTAMFYACWYFIRSQYAQYDRVLMYVGIFIRSWYVSTLSTAMFYACWYFIRSQYAQYSQLFHFIGMHAWLSSALPQSTACNKDS